MADGGLLTKISCDVTLTQRYKVRKEAEMGTTTVRISEDVYGRVRVIAGIIGTTPGDLLSSAFDEYFENHRDDFANHFELAEKLVFSDDVDSITQMTKSARSRRAVKASDRLRGASTRQLSDLPPDSGEGRKRGEARMDLVNLLRQKRKAILQIAAKNGAKRVRVFGSVARGEAREDSDVDFLVEFEEDRSLLDHSRLILDLEELLGRKVHVLTHGSLHSVIRDQVMAEARPL
jgi:uncharacterized protein